MRMVGLRREVSWLHGESWTVYRNPTNWLGFGAFFISLQRRIPILNLADFAKRLVDLNVVLTLQTLQVRDERRSRFLGKLVGLAI